MVISPRAASVGHDGGSRPQPNRPVRPSWVAFCRRKFPVGTARQFRPTRGSFFPATVVKLYVARAVCLLRIRCAMFLRLRISAGCLWEVGMLISPALAYHDTTGGGSFSIEAILPLIIIVVAIAFVLVFVGRKRGRRRKPRRAGSSHKRHR